MQRRQLGCLSALAVLFLLGIATWWLAFHNRGLNRDFDPEVVARAETKMWQAYYTRDTHALGRELLTLMHEQLGLSYASAARLTFTLGKATMQFANARGDYETVALPSLTQFYRDTHGYTGGDWDPDAVAKAELAWWVARRTPGEDSAESVGAKIADEYQLLYGATNPDIEAAGLLRAQAAVVRDQGGDNADWERIESMLVDSYTRLKSGVAL